jgi:hypothetical protein
MGLPNTKCSVCGKNEDPNWIIVPTTDKPDGAPICCACVGELVTRLRDEVEWSASGVLDCTDDLRYIGGIVERGTGKPLRGDVPVKRQILDYVVSLEAALAAERAEVARMATARALLRAWGEET